jgi:hypothetical protein
MFIAKKLLGCTERLDRQKHSKINGFTENIAPNLKAY